jgi:hypothetical protein
MPRKERLDAPVANVGLCEGVSPVEFIFLAKDLVLLDYCPGPLSLLTPFLTQRDGVLSSYGEAFLHRDCAKTEEHPNM